MKDSGLVLEGERFDRHLHLQFFFQRRWPLHLKEDFLFVFQTKRIRPRYLLAKVVRR